MRTDLSKHYFYFPIESDHLLTAYVKHHKTSISELARKLILKDMGHGNSAESAADTESVND